MPFYTEAPLQIGNAARATAYGLSDSTIATWTPGLERLPRLLVPIQLDALVVRKDGGNWADCGLRCAATAPAAGTPPVPLLKAPFSVLQGGRRPGVYLHWSLPAALTSGTPLGTAADPNGGPAQFPALPNRWLIARIFTQLSAARSPVPGPASTSGYGSLRTTRAWVLQSDAAVPVATELSAWTEPGPPNPPLSYPLTVVGPGDLTWAAYYDNVASRLAWFDDMRDLPQQGGAVAYLVCGWYSDSSVDPLSNPATAEAVLTAFGWTIPGELINLGARTYSPALGDYLNTAQQLALGVTGGVPPSTIAAGNESPPQAPAAYQTLYHGSTVGIHWEEILAAHPLVSGANDPALAFLPAEGAGGPPDPSKVKVALGSSVPETLGALVQDQAPTAGNDLLVEAAQLGAIREFEQPGGRATVDALLHFSGFSSQASPGTTARVVQPSSPLPAIPTSPPAQSTGIFGGPQTVTASKGPASYDPWVAAGIAKTTSSVTVRREAGLSLPIYAPMPGQVVTDPGLDASTTATLAAQSIGSATLGTFLQARLDASRTSSQANAAAQARVESSAQGAAPAPKQGVVPGTALTGGIDPFETVPESLVVSRAGPRYYRQHDPALLVAGVARSFKYGYDGRFSADGSLVCRVSGTTITALRVQVPGSTASPVTLTAQQLLTSGKQLDNGSIPPECESLLDETVLLDPGSAFAAAVAALPGTSASDPTFTGLAKNVVTEQTAVQVLRMPDNDPSALAANSGFCGTMPSVMAITPFRPPWDPRHLEWELQYIPAPNGTDGWCLGEVDYAPGAAALAALAARPPVSSAPASQFLTGRVILTGGGINSFADALQAAASTLPANDSNAAQLIDLAASVAAADVVGGSLDGFTAGLRLDPVGPVATPPASGNAPAQSPPAGFVALRSGFAQLTRLRVVDGYGQYVDLVARDGTPQGAGSVIVSAPAAVPNAPGIAALPPRFTAPGLLQLRFVDAAATPSDTQPAMASDTLSPLCGFVMPNHLDGSLEFFDDTGLSLGELRPDPVAGVVWDDAPGAPSGVGQTGPHAIQNPYLAAIAQGIMDWTVANPNQPEGALSAMLRVIDTTRWTVDPFGHVGDEHMALLVGHPVAVMRSVVEFSLRDSYVPGPDTLNTNVPVRLGSLAEFDDGLLGYFVDGDSRYCCVDAAAAASAGQIGPGLGYAGPVATIGGYDPSTATSQTAVEHPFVNLAGRIVLQPSRPQLVTLFVEPYTAVTATTGLVPRKQITMRRDWVAGPLAALAPTFQFGPVLTDPTTVRLPVAVELPGVWQWVRRTAPGQWSTVPVTNATGNAISSANPSMLSEGWLKLAPSGTTTG